MNNRKRSRAIARRKAEYSKRVALHKLLDVVLDINGVEERNRDITGYRPTVFLRISGHVGIVDIEVHRHGWTQGDRPEFSEWVNFDNLDNLIEDLVEERDSYE